MNKTRATSGIDHFDELLNESMRKAPPRRPVDACEVGRAALLLASDYTSGVTGQVLQLTPAFTFPAWSSIETVESEMPQPGTGC